MKDIYSIAATALLGSVSLFPAFAANKEKLNLLFIVTDEHNFRTLGCYRDLLPKDQAEIWGEGNVVQTPNIDRIAHCGVLFNRMYASSPVSTPARASMFTGKYPVELGMPNNSSKEGDGKYLRADVRTIAQCLDDAGYSTGYVGKLHLAEYDAKKDKEWWMPYPVGHEGYNYGFKDNRYMFNGGHGKYIGFTNDGKPYFSRSKTHTFVRNDKFGQPIFDDGVTQNVKGTTDWLTDRTLEFIDANKDKPFYCVLSIPDPHTPDAAIGKYTDMYKGLNLKFPDTYNADLPSDARIWQKPDGKARVLMTALPQYFGMVKDIDDNIGRILKKLEDDGILENTIIVFTSDHGDMMGEHARMNKGVVYEASMKVPFVIAQGSKIKNPVVPRGKVVTYATSTVDWMPTFLSLMNVPCPKVPGRDLTPLMSGNKVKGWNDVCFSQLGFIAAMDSRYKLRLSPYNNETPWLFDSQADPDELINFYGKPGYKEVTLRLLNEAKQYNKAHNKTETEGKFDHLIDTYISDIK